MNYDQTSHLPGILELKERVKRDGAVVSFYGNFVVVEFNEGVTVSYSTGFSLLIKGLSILKRTPWIYISHRKYSYSVNPTDYTYLNRVGTLKGIIVVRTDASGTQMEKLEAKFCKKPFFVVDTIEAAVKIGQGLLEF